MIKKKDKGGGEKKRKRERKEKVGATKLPSSRPKVKRKEGTPRSAFSWVEDLLEDCERALPHCLAYVLHIYFGHFEVLSLSKPAQPLLAEFRVRT